MLNGKIKEFIIILIGVSVMAAILLGTSVGMIEACEGGNKFVCWMMGD